MRIPLAAIRTHLAIVVFIRRDLNLFGWSFNVFDCSNRLKVLFHIFAKNLPGATVSLGSIVRTLPCHNCDTCRSPNFCSYEGCEEPGLALQKCTKNGCSNVMHHLCQIKYQEAHSLELEPFRCYGCHEGATLMRDISTLRSDVQRMQQVQRPTNQSRRTNESSHPPPFSQSSNENQNNQELSACQL